MSRKKSDAKVENIRIGERVQIGLEESRPPYPALLEDIFDDGRLIVSSPMYRGITLPVRVGQDAKLYFHREDGRYCIHACIDGILKHNKLRLLSLLPLSEPIKQQRRDSFRLPINLDASICYFDEQATPEEKKRKRSDPDAWHTTITHNLSETGVSIKSEQEFQIGDKIHVRLHLDNSTSDGQIDLLGTVRQIDLLGTVRQVDKLEPESAKSTPAYRLGIEFLPYDEKKRRLVAKYILRKQQIILKMRRNNEAL